jgi:hypothetical protein
MFQGSSKAFKKYDISFIGTGDNTVYGVRGHHFSPSTEVAKFYAKRILTNENTYINEVSLDGRFIEQDEVVDYQSMEEVIDNWYETDIFDLLVDDIDDKTDYSCDNEDIKRLATGLLTSNESDVCIRDLLNETNYGGWEGFWAEYKDNSAPMLIIPVDNNQYVSVGIGIYENAVMRFDGNVSEAHHFMSSNMELDGIYYPNFGNNGEQVQNLVVWNDDTIHLRHQTVAFEPPTRKNSMKR